MPIPDAAVEIFKVLFEWLEVIIIFVIIYMIVNLFTDGKGFSGLKDLFGGGGGGGDKTSSNRRPSGKAEKEFKEEKTDDKEPAEEVKTKPEDDANGLDVANPGLLQVRAYEEGTGTPLSGVTFHIFPKGHKKESDETKDDPRFMHIHGTTDPKGLYPPGGEPIPIGGGVVEIHASKAKWWNVTWFARGKYHQHTEALIQKGQTTIIPLVFRRKGEKPDFFNPFIMQVKEEDGKVVFEGQIKPGR
ncbi:hypothetical protein GOV07_05220 [Candidatus Woesearchaeota archaeon]|nr:hypothetical protein [Candidatus Woesearchaeota archaeon]